MYGHLSEQTPPGVTTRRRRAQRRSPPEFADSPVERQYVHGIASTGAARRDTARADMVLLNRLAFTYGKARAMIGRLYGQQRMDDMDALQQACQQFNEAVNRALTELERSIPGTLAPR